jgi:hypothetical protein
MHNSLPAACIVGNPQAGAELVQACMHLRTNGHWHSSRCMHNRAVLLDREDALALQMALTSVSTRLKQNYPVLIIFYGERNVTTTLVEILEMERRALESILGRIMAGNIKVPHQYHSSACFHVAH